MQRMYGTPTSQEEEDAVGWLFIPMNRDDPPEVMMVGLEQEQLFFLAHPEGGRELSEVQLIRQAIQKLRACGPLYGRALSVWNSKDSHYRKCGQTFVLL